MQTRLFVSVLIYLVTSSLAAFAQDTSQPARTGSAQADIVGPLPPVAGSLACYKLVDEPSFCVLPESPRVVNHTIPFNVIDLNGAWIGPGGERPYIYLYNEPSAGAGYTIAVDMSLLSRPDGFGYFVNASTIAIVFPDAGDFRGTIEANGKSIRWSNNTVWNKQ